jgi:hypothetical protein
MEKKLKLHT